MIRKFVEGFDRAVAASPVVLSSAIEKYFSPDADSVYIKGTIRFIDSSSLDIAVFVLISASGLSVDKYRFHYMDKNAQLVFRYDNAPHYPEVETHPHHRHTRLRVTPSGMPTIEEILQEIGAGIFASEP